MPGRREGWAEGWVGKEQEVEERIMAREEEEGGVMVLKRGPALNQKQRHFPLEKQ